MSSKTCIKVIVVSDMVYEGKREDVSGELALRTLSESGYCIGEKVVVRNSYREILKAIKESSERVIILLGGTGPSPRDISVDLLESISWRCLPGFGELFRWLSFQKIGANAILTRTELCILFDGKVATVLPGSPDAVQLGLDLLLKIIDHLIEEVDRYESPHRGVH